MSDEIWITNDVIKQASGYETYCIRIEGGVWKFDKCGIRFERDDGSEVTVATVPMASWEDEE